MSNSGKHPENNSRHSCRHWLQRISITTFRYSYGLPGIQAGYKIKNSAVLNYQEALYAEKARNAFFVQLDELLKNEMER